MLEDMKQTVQEAAETFGDRAQQRKVDMKVDARLKAIERSISQVDTRIEALGKRFPRTQGPRFPFGLVLLAGLGYALYNKSTRSRLLGLVGNISPAARDTIEGVMGRAGDAADDIKAGRDPQAAVKDAAQDIGHKVNSNADDMKRDVQKAGDRLADKADGAANRMGDKVEGVADDARRGADRLADRAGDAAERAGDKAQNVADDAKRGVDRLADKARDNLNDLKR